ncbi:MAG: peptidylprolyl isomerase [Candidatus Kerfeldbacteria bacterium]|nr:peptidylprolyl isomerase [Candidatus Kerfeldbacteria bacterium]
MTTYSHPGVLPDEKIKQKRARLQTNKGTIVFELFADDAPATVSNFVYLTEADYYNGVTFHRVVPGFVIQGGDPTGTGAGGPGYRFPDEPVRREYDEGIVAMANAGPDTNGSQFFIMLADNNSLPKAYTIFGKVIEGMDVVKRIVAGDVMEHVRIESGE